LWNLDFFPLFAFRSLIHAAARNERDQASEDDDGSKAMGDVMLKIELVWHLSEILFLDVQPGESRRPAVEVFYPHDDRAYWKGKRREQ
jgi:hypothetical protein